MEITFVKADSKEKLKSLGKQAGDHVFLTLETDNCHRDYEAMKAKGVKFMGEPQINPTEQRLFLKTFMAICSISYNDHDWACARSLLSVGPVPDRFLGVNVQTVVRCARERWM